MASGQTSVRTASAVASQGVVQDYLDVLLRNVLPEEPTPPETEPERYQESALDSAVRSASPVGLSINTRAAVPVLQEAAIPQVVGVKTVTPVAPALDRTVSGSRPDVLAATPETVATEPVRGVAPWADKPFASLLFDVMGLKLAAPLHELGGIMPLADRLQPMAAQADWFMGLIRWNGRTIRVVDTARFVMPEKVDAGHEIEYQSVVVLGDSHWALAVNNADQSVHLQPADIRWRKTPGKRPWLAGTVLQRLCALLDVDVLIKMLDDSDTAQQVKAELANKK